MEGTLVQCQILNTFFSVQFWPTDYGDPRKKYDIYHSKYSTYLYTAQHKGSVGGDDLQPRCREFCCSVIPSRESRHRNLKYALRFWQNFGRNLHGLSCQSTRRLPSDYTGGSKLILSWTGPNIGAGSDHDPAKRR